MVYKEIDFIEVMELSYKLTLPWLIVFWRPPENGSFMGKKEKREAVDNISSGLIHAGED